MNTTIRPGRVWLDTNGNRIPAQGGSLVVARDRSVVWCGENRVRTIRAPARHPR